MKRRCWIYRRRLSGELSRKRWIRRRIVVVDSGFIVLCLRYV